MADNKETQPKADATSRGLQKQADEAEQKGFLGVKVDPTPNEEYSLESDSWNTPEADRDALAKAAGDGAATARFGEA